MPQRSSVLSIRSFREGDEETLAHLFNGYLGGSVGPIRVTPDSWLAQFRHQSWTGPSVGADADCVRIAESHGQVMGYAVTDYKPEGLKGGAVVQELCVTDDDGAAEVAAALLADAEARAVERGKSFIESALSLEDGRAADALTERGYDTHSDSDSVFMAAVPDPAAFLGEVRGELRRRLDRTRFRDWEGSLRINAGDVGCLLRVSRTGIAAEPSEDEGEADIVVTVDPEMLPLLLFGRAAAGELYTQDGIAVTAGDRDVALDLLTALFPRLPTYLPRAQWW
jgi:hypothetical protein